jgi:hypothetical protein
VNKDIPTRSQDTAHGTSTGLYDIVMYIVKSFPAVVMVGLLAYGALYAFREVFSLQTQIIVVERQKAEAEIKKSQAEADAKAAANIDKYEALQEVSKQLIELNSISANVSNRIQDLVSSQIDNMKKSEELAKLQNEKAKEYQSQLEQASQNELSKLQAQIAEATKKANEQVIAAAITGYNEIKNTIALVVNRGGFVDAQILELLGQKLNNPIAAKQAASDIVDSNDSWTVRATIAIQLFKKTSNAEYLHQARSLIENNKRANQRAISSVLTEYGALSPQQYSVVNDMIIDFILDAGFDREFRTDLLTAGFRWSDNLKKEMGPDKVERLAKYAGDVLVETVSASTAYCFQITSLLELLGKLSQEAALVYAHRALKNPRGAESERQCIKTELDNAIGTDQPTPEMIQQWAVQ